MLQRGLHPSSESRRVVQGLLFISPWLIGFLIFAVYPIAASAFYSFTQYDVLTSPKFVGFANYAELLTRDETMRVVTQNTFWWVGIAVPLGVAVAFLLANFLNAEIWGRSAFRAIFFIPSIIPAVVATLVWQWVLNPQYGLIDGYLASLGLRIIPFLGSPLLSKPTLTLVHCWAQGSAIVIFLAALQDVPRTLYEAALVDGANAWHRFWRITVPLCTPAMLFLLVTGLIGGFQNFTFPWLLTQGGPARSTEFYSIYLYRNAFMYFKMGYASALAWLLFLLVVVVTVLVFRSSARWAYYGSSE